MLTTHLKVDLDKFHHNVKQILSYKKGTFMFVIKGNAYGHGIHQIAKELNIYENIEFYGVSSLQEALILEQYTDKKIVVLGYIHSEELYKTFDKNIIPTIFSLEQARILPKDSSVFINVNTGFHRLGKKPSKEYKVEITQIQNHCIVLGIFTHLTLADNTKDIKQIQEFEEFVKDFDIKYKSISDSIGYTRYQTNENLYRIGSLMFGLESVKELGKIDVHPIASLVTSITRIDVLEEDDSLGYRTKHVSKGTKIATIMTGYGDGLFRSLPKDTPVMTEKGFCHFIEVGMDQSIIDITDKNLQVGDEVTVFGDQAISIQTMSELCKTNKNNILTLVPSHVTRVYKQKAKDDIVINQFGGEGTWK